MSIPYALIKHLDSAQATIIEYAQLIRMGRINPAVDGRLIDDYPVAILDEVDRPFTVVLAAEDPRVEVRAEPDGTAVLAAHWGEHQLERRDPDFDVFLAYLTKQAARR